MTNFDSMQKAALDGLTRLMKAAYLQAIQKGEVIKCPDGVEEFTCHFPAPVNKDCRAFRMSDGTIRMDLKSMHELMGGEAFGPWEHFEHMVDDFAARRAEEEDK